MRYSTLFSIGLSLLEFCLASPSLETRQIQAARNSSAANTTCTTGVHIIVARASAEQPGQGIIGAVATQVQQTVPRSDSEAVDYPATLTDYPASEGSGVAAMRQLIQSYTERCLSSKIALLGYSQGAQVAGDVMCGTDLSGFNSTPALGPALSRTQDVGTSNKTGIFPRLNAVACSATVGGISQSYCNSNDRFCDNETSTPVHLSYVNVFGTQAAQFIVSKINSIDKVNGTAKINGPAQLNNPHQPNDLVNLNANSLRFIILWLKGVYNLLIKRQPRAGATTSTEPIRRRLKSYLTYDRAGNSLVGGSEHMKPLQFVIITLDLSYINIKLHPVNLNPNPRTSPQKQTQSTTMIGRLGLTLSAAASMLGPYIADFNETHVLNPRWPPHARFHNGQTMSMGLCLGLATLYYTWHFKFSPNNTLYSNNDREKEREMEKERQNLTTAAVFGTLYWVTGLSAILYPGSLGTDPEFGEGFPQLYAFSLFAASALVGAWWECHYLDQKMKRA
ncbi:hypothetical protein G7Y89_g6501 [Cudoniella acicularis]|uniref:Cutinase n=1 Tax=Cudoniella acicularis TaxID=354080 RepID=A0A8H4RM48_9HELO|nr:hypothetical protein G7Y89_g6501 [Cudoniella acicularis]